MYNEPSNLLRSVLLRVGVLIYRLGLARVVLWLTRNRVRAMLYHDVDEEETGYTQGLGVTVTPAMFNANLDFFKQYYNVVSVTDLASSELPANPLVITFDDGYKSVYRHAFPLLKQHQMPACVYLITRAVEDRLVWVNGLNWALIEHKQEALEVCHQFDALRGLESRGTIVKIVQNNFRPEETRALMQAMQAAVPFDPKHQLYASVENINEMKDGRIEFGFHTHDHFNLRNCNEQDLGVQLDHGSIAELMNSPSFAYPFGYFNRLAINHVSAGSYQHLMTVGNNNDRFCAKHLDRIEVFSSDPAVVFARLEVVEPIIGRLRAIVLMWRRARGTAVKMHTQDAETGA